MNIEEYVEIVRKITDETTQVQDLAQHVYDELDKMIPKDIEPLAQVMLLSHLSDYFNIKLTKITFGE